MSRYEVLVLAVPEITQAESGDLESHIHNLITQQQGKVLAFDRWGKYRLAYPVRKNDYGVYFLVRFEIPEAVKPKIAQEFKTLLAVKYNTLVMRYLIDVLDAHASLEYKRPTPLDELPKAVDEFLKENNMEGLMADGRMHKDDLHDELL